MTGWTEDQILAQRAQWLDWLLAYDDLMTELESQSHGGERR